MVFMKEFFEKVNFGQYQQTTKNVKKKELVEPMQDILVLVESARNEFSGKQNILSYP